MEKRSIVRKNFPKCFLADKPWCSIIRGTVTRLPFPCDKGFQSSPMENNIVSLPNSELILKERSLIGLLCILVLELLRRSSNPEIEWKVFCF